ncbi:hypothetical protein BYT27DRAFT_7213456 [Phlegmacium glaucopus]|nr:hypothetical protein BYT27DRAFT_7213456 [Phlegmacium glaucopus]
MSKPAQVNMSTRALVIRPAGHNAGLLKGQVNCSKGLAAATSSQTTSSKTANQKIAIKKFNNYQSMENAEHQMRLEELELQIQLAHPDNHLQQPSFDPVQSCLPPSAYNTPTPIPSTTVNTSDFSLAKSLVTPFEIQASFSSPSFGSFGAEAEGTSMLEGPSSDDWMKSGSNIFANENNFDDIYSSQ